MELQNSDYTILVVDDNDANLLLLRSILKNSGFNVLLSRSAAEAFSLLPENMVDVIIMDVMMPGMDGYQATSLLREKNEYKDIPVIFLTALVTGEDIIKCFNAGGSDYVSKPFNKDELIIRLKHQLSIIAAKKIIVEQNTELQKIMQHRDRLYSVIAHDLRGPLGTIKMIMECLQTNLQTKSIGMDNMELLLEANKLSDELFQLLDNLLKWTKNQLGHLDVVNQKIKIKDLIVSVCDFYSMASLFKSIRIQVNADDNLCVLSDMDMIKTVLRNFINNAIKFSYVDSEIIVGARMNNDRIEIYVQDFGAGMSEEIQQKLREKEFLPSTFGTNKEDGTGMGLVLCQDLIQRLGGEFDFVSEAGVGSTFKFSVRAGSE